jgi:amidase
MISEADYMQYDALGLAELVRRKEVSASELVDAAIARATAVNPQLNAIVIPMYEIARERARQVLAGPLAGVPFLIKDLFQDYAGVLATSGCSALRRAAHTPRVHSEIVRRWLDAGTVILGRTNTPEFGVKAVTEPDAWGPTRNPWNVAHSPGGSSGGSAAAVAAGIVPAAGAGDGGGSIRIPAAATGLFGLKPGRGRTPCGPGLDEMMHGAAVNHVISRSVRDSACLLDATCAPEAGVWFRTPAPELPYLTAAARDPQRLRIAFSARSPLGGDVDPAAVAAVEQTAKLLAELGHEVVPAEPSIDGVQLARDFLQVWCAQLSHHLDTAREVSGSRNGFELDSLALEAVAKGRSASDYVAAYSRWNDYAFALGSFLAEYALFMTPTLALPPPLIGTGAMPPWAALLLRVGMPLGLARLIEFVPEAVERVSFENVRNVPFTQLANLTGVPAMSVPLHQFGNGLPLGIHFMAAHGGESTLFSLAGQLERAAPWSQRRPVL